MKTHSLRTFIPFLFLIGLWTLFFATFKFFLWNDLRSTLWVDLQTIAWYLSLGASFSYLIGGAFAYAFVKKHLLLTISFFITCIVWIIALFWLGNMVGFIISLISIGFLYGLWTVMRNVLVSVEIEKTGYSDIFVNALAGIVFTVFIIGGSLMWSILFEKYGSSWYLFIIFLLFLTIITSSFLDYDRVYLSTLLEDGFGEYVERKKKKIKMALSSYIPELRYILSHYFPTLLTSAVLWSTSAAVSQQAIEFSVDYFHKLPSESSFILLYSAVWVILWNIFSIKMQTNRWFYFTLFTLLYGIMILAFPFLAFSYFFTVIMAFGIWIFFWISSNLIDAYYLKIISEENKKEYGASTYGLIISLTLFATMILSSWLTTHISYIFSLFVAWSIVIIITLYFFLYIKNFEKSHAEEKKDVLEKKLKN